MPICRPDPDERAQAFRQLRSESDAVEMCWALALRFKHFELEADSTARGVFDEEAYVSAPAAWPPEMSAGAKERVSITIPLVSSVALTVRASADFTARAVGFLPRSTLTRR